MEKSEESFSLGQKVPVLLAISNVVVCPLKVSRLSTDRITGGTVNKTRTECAAG